MAGKGWGCMRLACNKSPATPLGAAPCRLLNKQFPSSIAVPVAPAVKLVAAMGGKPYVLTRSAGKVEDAKRLGAEGVILTSDEASMKSMENQLDAILDTVSAAHQVTTYANLIRVGGKYVVVGVPDEAYTIPPTLLIFKRLTLAGSLIGGIQASGGEG